MANYKRKGHRGRHKKNTLDNQAQRCAGNGRYSTGRGAGSLKDLTTGVGRGKAERNRVEPGELD